MLNDHNHVARSEEIFEQLLETNRAMKFGEMALALREHIWQGCFELDHAHSLSQRLGDCDDMRRGTSRFASSLQALALAHNLLWVLRQHEEEFHAWLRTTTAS